MNGQYTVFDTGNRTKPCEYSFKRYMGQAVRFRDGKVGKIVNIFSYYTYVKDEHGFIYVGTPHDICPVED